MKRFLLACFLCFVMASCTDEEPLPGSNDREKFLDEMFRALWGFISDKLQIPVSDLSKDSAAQALIARKVPEGLVMQFNETVDMCEFARFAGGMAESNEAIYKKGIEVISQLESTLG